jgi:hypothetical protein
MIFGKKGGGKSKSEKEQGGREDPDTLQSTDIARIVDVIGEGEILGLASGAKSIYLDDTPLQDEGGDYNFQGVTWQFLNGTPDQNYIEGFPAVEEEISVGAVVNDHTPIVRTIDDENVDAVRMKISITQGLSELDDKGNLKGSYVTFAIDVRPNGGAFQEVPLAWQYNAIYAAGTFFYTPSPTTAIYAVGALTFGTTDNTPCNVRIECRKKGSSDSWQLLRDLTFIPNQGEKIYTLVERQTDYYDGPREPRGGRDR